MTEFKDEFIHSSNSKPEKILYENQDEILKTIIDLLKKDMPQDAEAIIFGSLAESKFSKYKEIYHGHFGSDIDVIVFIEKENIPAHWKYLNVSKRWWDLFRGIKIEINGTIHKTDILVVKDGFEDIARQRIKEKQLKIIKII